MESKVAETAKRKAYPAYKPSDVEWLGEIPSTWSTTPVKRHYDIKLGKMLQNNPMSEKDRLVPYIKAVHVNWARVDTQDLPSMWASPDEIPQYEVVSNDLLVCEGGEVGRAAMVANPPAECIIQNALHRVRPRKHSDARFLMYVLHTVSAACWFEVLCNKATIAHFTSEKFADLRIPVTDLGTQRAIATFLDRETARIDGLIAKKQRQIELLQEKRAALISHAVTKGLDPNAPMKDSGIEWLGEIPEHWESGALKRFVEPNRPITYGIVQCGEDVPNGVPYIRPVDMTDEGGTDLDGLRRTASEIAAAYLRSTIRPGDIVVSIGPSFGKVMIVPEALDGANLTQGTARVAPSTDVLTRFLFWCLRSGAVHQAWEALVTGATFRALNLEPLSRTIVAVPPLPEQRTIAAFLDRETERIDVAVSKVEQSVAMLREYRTALISAAVTGKIDVRGEMQA